MFVGFHQFLLKKKKYQVQLTTNLCLASKALNEDSSQIAYLLCLAYSKPSVFWNSRWKYPNL